MTKEQLKQMLLEKQRSKQQVPVQDKLQLLEEQVNEEIVAEIPYDYTGGSKPEIKTTGPKIPPGTPNRTIVDGTPDRFLVSDGYEYDTASEAGFNKVQELGWGIVIENGEGERDIVSPQNLHKAQAAGFQPVTEFQLKLDKQREKTDAINPVNRIDEFRSVYDGVMDGASWGFRDEIAGNLEAIGSKFGVRGLGGGFNELRAETDEEDKESYSEVYTSRRDQRREESKLSNLANPGSYTAGGIAGSVLSGVGPAKLAGNTLKGITAMSAAEGGLYGLGSSEKEDLTGQAVDAATGAAIGLGTFGTLKGGEQLLKGAGKGVDAFTQAAKKFIPGSSKISGTTREAAAKAAGKSEKEIKRALEEPSIPNWLASKVGKLAGSGEVDELEQLFKLSPAERAKIRKTDIPSEVIKTANESNTILKEVNTDLKKMYRTLDDVVDNFSFISDMDNKVLQSFSKYIKNTVNEVVNNKDFYSGNTSKVVRGIDKIIEGLSPKAGPDSTPARRLLESRRYLDDILDNREFDTLGRYDKNIIRTLRNDINRSLSMTDAGKFGRDWIDPVFTTTNDAIKGITSKITDKTGRVDPTKLNTLLKTTSPKGEEFRQALEVFEKELKILPEIGLAKAYVDNSQLDRVVKNFKAIDNLIKSGKILKTERGSDNFLKRVFAGFAASSTGGLSLLALPATNPSLYLSIVDLAENTLEPKARLMFKKLLRGIDEAQPAIRSAIIREMIKIKQQDENNK